LPLRIDTANDIRRTKLKLKKWTGKLL
jgi:hypothetical protein